MPHLGPPTARRGRTASIKDRHFRFTAAAFLMDQRPYGGCTSSSVRYVRARTYDPPSTVPPRGGLPTRARALSIPDLDLNSTGTDLLIVDSLPHQARCGAMPWPPWPIPPHRTCHTHAGQIKMRSAAAAEDWFTVLYLNLGTPCALGTAVPRYIFFLKKYHATIPR
eukprot:SAG31_NODE_845_length_11547_cov_8.098096_10_plen_166_part_00